MFVELELFKRDKEVYNQSIKEINDTSQNEEELQKKIEEANEKFKSQVRRYLPSALNIIKTIFQCEYSIYKIGKDFNSEFKVVETNVRKTKPEVIAEMNEFKLKAETMNLTEQDINKINIAMDILLTYSEDALEQPDELKEDYMKHAKITTSSIVNTTSRVNNAFAPTSNEIQHNPYANQEINNSSYANQQISTGFKNDDYDAKPLLVDPFASLYNGTVPAVESNTLIQDNFGIGQDFINQSQEISMHGASAMTPQTLQSNPTLDLLNESTIQTAMAPQTQLQNIDFAVPSVNANMSYGDNNTFIQTNNAQTTTLQKSNQDAGWKIKNQKDEKSTLLLKILSGVLISILSVTIAILMIFLLEQSFVVDLFDRINNDIIINIIFILITSILSIIFGFIIIGISRLRTRYIGKFLVLPSMLTSSFMMFLLQIIELLEDIIDKPLYKYYETSRLTIMFFIFFLFIRALFRKKEKSGRIKWNIVEKISFITLIYIIFIPLIFTVLNLFKVDLLSNHLKYIYDFDNSNYIIGGVAIILSLIMIILNKKEDKRV